MSSFSKAHLQEKRKTSKHVRGGCVQMIVLVYRCAGAHNLVLLDNSWLRGRANALALP